MYSVILRSSSYLKKNLITNVIICEYADALDRLPVDGV